MTRALIVVDVQNDFAHPDGSLFVPYGDLVPEKVNVLIPEYEHVIYTKDYHPPVTKHFNDYGGTWPAHCIGGTWGAEFHEDLKVIDGAPVILKGTHPDEDGYSGFTVDRDGSLHATGLEEELKKWMITAVDIVGIALDVCVKATALDAVELGYYTRVLDDATASVTGKGGEDAIFEMRDKGVH